MKKFLKELYKNFPELEKSEEDINKAVYYLKDNKPVFNASKEFKSTLKIRLKNIISIKSQKKSSFIIFAIPVFSFLFIVVGFTYYFKQINFLNNVKNIEKGLYDIDTLESEVAIILEKTPMDSNFKNTISEIKETGNENIRLFNIDNKIDNKKEDLVFKNTKVILDEPVKIENNTKNDELKRENTGLENDDINDMLGVLGEMYPDSGESSYPVSTYPYPGDTRMGIESDSLMMKSTSFYMIYDEEYMSFEDYCLTNSGAVLQNDKVKLCRVKQKYCLSSEYLNGVCEFKEIK